MDCATFSGSAQSSVSGRPVRTPQNPQERVHILPRIMKVAVPSVQHSPMFGQDPEVQMVCKSYLSTKPRNSVYFLPTGSFTRSHFGLDRKSTRLNSSHVRISYAVFCLKK